MGVGSTEPANLTQVECLLARFAASAACFADSPSSRRRVFLKCNRDLTNKH
jgi:hypothetical protein